MKLRLGYSPCPNDTFIFHAWVHGLVPGAPPVEAVLADIDELNAMALRGEPEVTKLSFAALTRVRERYALLHAGGALVDRALERVLGVPPRQHVALDRRQVGLHIFAVGHEFVIEPAPCVSVDVFRDFPAGFDDEPGGGGKRIPLKIGQFVAVMYCSIISRI